MEPKLLLAATLLAFAGTVSTASAQLDLTPKPGVFFGEGTPFPCVRFRDGGKVVRFMPPPDWKFTEEGPRCAFHPGSVAQAYGSFATVQPRKDAAGDPSERLQELLKQKLPAEATAIEFKLTGLPGVKLDRWPAQHVQASYEHFGQKFRLALLVVPLEREELLVRFGSRATDFDRLFTPLLESLGTFTWDPTDEDPPKPAKSVAR